MQPAGTVGRAATMGPFYGHFATHRNLKGLCGLPCPGGGARAGPGGIGGQWAKQNPPDSRVGAAGFVSAS